MFSVQQLGLALLCCCVAVFLVWNDGVVHSGLVDVALFGAVLVCMPFLANRHQHLRLAHERASVQAAINNVPAGGERLIRALSYNIFMRPSLWFVRNNEDDHKNERLQAFYNHLDSFDVICLQEMFGLLSFRQRSLLSEAQRRGFSHAAVAGAPPYLFWDRHWTFKIPFLDAGLVILSRHPILETDSHYYRLGHHIDGWAPKQVLWALVQLPGQDNFLHVFNTHMQASYYDAPSETADMARAKQVNELAEFVAAKVYDRPGNRRYPALICGDLNLDGRTHRGEGPHSLDYVRMMDILHRLLDNPEEGFTVRDLLWDSCGEHPVTYGDVIHDPATGKQVPRETVLTHTADHCCAISIDYIMFLGPRDDMGVVRHMLTRVEPFFCVNQEAGPCQQLSDHYGIVSDLVSKP